MPAIRVVTLKQPCSACLIVEGLVREIVARLQEEVPGLQVELTVLERLEDMRGVENLEVEKFPAVFIGDEQITAGTIPDRRQLLALLREGEHT